MSDGSPVLDVRIIPPREKHTTIFSRFDSLVAGQAFVLVNDHDPIPLKNQFDFTRPGQCDWKYLEQGPEVWRVQLTRK